MRKGDSDSDVGEEERVPALLLAATTTRQKEGRKGEKLVIKSTFFPVPLSASGRIGWLTAAWPTTELAES